MTEKLSHDSRAVANAVLEYAKTKALSLTPMQVIKLVYLCHGWSLALHPSAMVENEPQAWQYGPVYPPVYKAFKHFGSNPVTDRARNKETGDAYEALLDSDQQSLLRDVVDAYGKLGAFQLSNLMHQDGTPWHKSYTASPYSRIPEASMKEHFLRLYNERTNA